MPDLASKEFGPPDNEACRTRKIRGGIVCDAPCSMIGGSMMHWRPFRSLVALVVAILIAAGPGSPLCNIALARTQMPAMTGCDMSGPAKDKTVAPHPDCAAPCVAIACPAPDIAVRPVKTLPPESPVLQLTGVTSPPEAEPPRS